MCHALAFLSAFGLLLCEAGLGTGSATDDLPNNKPASVETRVIKIVADQFGLDPKKIMRSTNLVKDLGADELDRVELVLELEDRFEIRIDDEVAEKFETVGQMVDHVAKAIKSGKPGVKGSAAGLRRLARRDGG